MTIIFPWFMTEFLRGNDHKLTVVKNQMISHETNFENKKMTYCEEFGCHLQKLVSTHAHYKFYIYRVVQNYGTFFHRSFVSKFIQFFFFVCYSLCFLSLFLLIKFGVFSHLNIFMLNFYKNVKK